MFAKDGDKQKLAEAMSRYSQNATANLSLSEGQRALWFLQRNEPESCAYNTAFTVRLRSAVDETTLGRALLYLMMRHSSLRTLFKEDSGEPKQSIYPHLLPDFRLVDAKGWDDQTLYEQVLEAYRKPFDLEKGSLFRARLFRTAADDHVLLLSFHHIICDAWSIWVLMAELPTCYTAAAQGRKPELERLSVGYAAFLNRQEQLLASEKGEMVRDFWHHHLEGHQEPLNLHPDHPRPSVLPSKGASLFFDLTCLNELRQLARARGTTIFNILLAAYYVLLQRYSGQNDLVVGTPVSGRDHHSLTSLVGYLVNPIPLRCKIENSVNFYTLLEQVTQISRQGIAHGAYPFPALVRSLQQKRDVSHTPVFQTLFVLQKHRPGMDLGVWDHMNPEPYEIAQMEGQFELMLELRESLDALGGTFKYHPDLFEEATITAMVESFQALLEALLTSPDVPLAQLSLVSEKKHEQMRLLWQGAPFDPAPPMLIPQQFLAQVKARGEQSALIDEHGDSMSYTELAGRVNELAGQLMEHGVGPDVRVAVCLQRSPEMVISLLAILQAGGAYVPLDPEYPLARLNYMLEDSDPAVLISVRSLAESFKNYQGTQLLLSGELSPTPAASLNSRSVNAQNLAYIIYTSGSTGRPKGAMNSHLAIANRLQWMQAAFELDVTDRVLQKTPFSFDVSVWEFFWPLITGATLVLARPGGQRDKTYLARTIKWQDITTLHFVPSMLSDFLQAENVALCTSLKRVICSGEALDDSLRDRFYERLDVDLFNLYGPTEAAVDVTWTHCSREKDQPVTLGRPIAGVETVILDRHNQITPMGVPGELHLGGLAPARGYFQRPGLTASRFVPHPFAGPGKRLYRTGDLCRFRWDGSIEYLGRMDHQFKLRGLRIEAGEIESALSLLPGVRDAIVLLDDRQERLVAFTTGDDLGNYPWRETLKQTLPDYMVPSSLLFIESLPLTPNGKLDRKALLARAHNTLSSVGDKDSGPQNDIESKVAAIWCDLLSLESVGRNQNFFEVGGHSLLLTRLQVSLQETFGTSLSTGDMFRFPTIASMAQRLGGKASIALEVPRTKKPDSRAAIAIIGVGLRFPDACDPHSFWENLSQGRESIHHFSEEDLLAAGHDRETIGKPNYVSANGSLKDIDLFDARFFDIPPAEAALMDPQHRIALECAWESMEDAGYDPERNPHSTGVFAGVGLNSYLLNNLIPMLEGQDSVNAYQTMLANDKDYLPSRIAFKLNLRGPAYGVQTACSSSLAAVHLAIQSLRSGDCRMALAGGVSIRTPQVQGYLHTEGMILSPDGSCRAFDADAAGTVGGNGAGFVLLKLLEDAQEDGDAIRAVILGSATNNDGRHKVGYTAPSVSGQAEVLRAALLDSDSGPETVSYVEAHGTGTPMGDPIELEALNLTFGDGAREKPCYLGSVKTNLGHLDAAAGVAGLIKTTLALEHQALPPSLHYQTPNPRIDFGQFVVNRKLRPWPTIEGKRRAGVSAFGIGGTNVHVVLEQAEPLRAERVEPKPQLLCFSGKSPQTLDAQTEAMAQYLEGTSQEELGSVATTLALGRSQFEQRTFVVGETALDLAKALSEKRWRPYKAEEKVDVVFLFSGQGAQYPGMAQELFEHEPVFRKEVEDLCSMLEEARGLNLLPLLFPKSGEEEQARERLKETAVTQPALFIIEMALASLWMDWGVKPAAVMGHSVGEYVAACVAGVMTKRDALLLLADRGELIAALPRGGMLAVAMPEQELRGLLGKGLSLAAINGPDRHVVSGNFEALEALRASLNERGIRSVELATSHAFHSPMMVPAMEDMKERAQNIDFSVPVIPMISNLTGNWMALVPDANYWVRHLREPVRFNDGLTTLLAERGKILLEIGPGTSLKSLAMRHPSRERARAILSSLEGPNTRGDRLSMLNSLGRLWSEGVPVDWSRVYAHTQKLKAHLPTYPWQRQRHWIEPEATKSVSKSLESTAYLPNWHRIPPNSKEALEGTLLVFAPDNDWGRAFNERLISEGRSVIQVLPGDTFSCEDETHWHLRAHVKEDYIRLLNGLHGNAPTHVVYAWGCLDALDQSYESQTQDCFYGPLYLMQALGEMPAWGQIHISVITFGLQDVLGTEKVKPSGALAIGPTIVANQEYGHLQTRLIDVEEDFRRETLEVLVKEVLGPDLDEPQLAIRGVHRWAQTFTPLANSQPPKEATSLAGAIVIMGGMGGIGRALSDHLAKPGRKIAILSRSLRSSEDMDWTYDLEINQQAQEWRTRGAEIVFLGADLADRSSLAEALGKIQRLWGHIDTVIHAAGIAGGGLIRLKEKTQAEEELSAKVAGLLHLEEIFAPNPPSLMVLCASILATTGGVGQTTYVSANAFMDAFARSKTNSTRKVISIGWDRWQGIGMASEAERIHRQLTGSDLEGGMSLPTALDLFERSCSFGIPELRISTSPLDERVRTAWNFQLQEPLSRETEVTDRPEGLAPYLAPHTPVQQELADLWSDVLGISKIGLNDSFSELGGDSLAAVRLTARISEKMGVSLSVAQLYEDQDLGTLVSRIEALQWSAQGRAESITHTAIAEEGSI